MRMFIRAFLLLVVSSTVLAGCWFRHDVEKCRSVQEYQVSAGANPVVVPPDLSPPDLSGKLAIPNGPVPVKPLADNAACLARPPEYFRKSVPGDAKEPAGKAMTAPAATPANPPVPPQPSKPPTAPPPSGR